MKPPLSPYMLSASHSSISLHYRISNVGARHRDCVILSFIRGLFGGSVCLFIFLYPNVAGYPLCPFFFNELRHLYPLLYISLCISFVLSPFLSLCRSFYFSFFFFFQSLFLSISSSLSLSFYLSFYLFLCFFLSLYFSSSSSFSLALLFLCLLSACLFLSFSLILCLSMAF